MVTTSAGSPDYPSYHHIPVVPVRAEICSTTKLHIARYWANQCRTNLAITYFSRTHSILSQTLHVWGTVFTMIYSHLPFKMTQMQVNTPYVGHLGMYTWDVLEVYRALTHPGDEKSNNFYFKSCPSGLLGPNYESIQKDSSRRTAQ